MGEPEPYGALRVRRKSPKVRDCLRLEGVAADDDGVRPGSRRADTMTETGSLHFAGIYLRLCRAATDGGNAPESVATTAAHPRAKKGPIPSMEVFLLLVTIVLSIALSLGLGAGLLTLLLRFIQTHSS